MMNVDPIAVIEAAYRLGGSERAWMQQILRVVRPWWDDGFGVSMFALTLDAGGRPSIGETAFDSDRPDFLRDTILAMNARLDTREIEHTYERVNIYSTLSERMAPVEDFRENAIYRELAHPHGIYDCAGVQIADPSGTMIMMAAPRRQITTTTEEERHRWARLAAHVAAGYRLRRGYMADEGFDGGVDDGVDAVLSPEGRVVHLSERFLAEDSSSPEGLELAAEAIGRARGGMRSAAPDDALALWKVLVEGRYSLVEQIDTDGKRMFVARLNEAVADAPPALSRAERQVIQFAVMGHPDRLISYELGLPLARIEALMASGLRALGLSSRHELRKLWEAMQRQQEG